MLVRPLTRPRKDGTVLARSAEVEEQILSAIQDGPAELVRRAGLATQDEGYLREEALVCLIREHHRRDNDEVAGALAQELIRRCAKLAEKRFRALGEDEAEEAYHDLMQALFERILDLQSDRGDFLQVRFWRALDRLAISTFRRFAPRVFEEQKTLIQLSELRGYDREDGNRDARRSISPTDIKVPAASVERLVLAEDGLRRLPDNHRVAYILYYGEDWPIESNDPTVPTISKFFCRDPRTIRNWLRAAEQALAT